MRIEQAIGGERGGLRARRVPSGLKALRALFEAEAPAIVEQRARILGLERTIAAAVHEAYGLTPGDLELLRATQPPRMPPGW